MIEKGEKIDLRLIGEGSEEAVYKKMAVDAGITDSLSFLGPKRQKDVRALMRWADIFVLPSRYETFGVVLIEALATGTPVVSTCSGGPESIVTDSDLGSLVPIGDGVKLGEAILEQKRRLLDKSHKLVEQADRLHKKIEDRFSSDSRAKIILDDLTALAKERLVDD